MGRGRRLAAGASLLASAGGFALNAFRHGFDWVDWRSLAFGAGLAAASVALTRKNLVGQVMARGLTWILFAPCAIVTGAWIYNGHIHETAVPAFALSTGLALFLARPMLHTDEARAAFAPSKFRRSFLAACTAAVTIGLVTGMAAWEFLWSNSVLAGLGLAALGTSIIASAFGVLRMRGWGIALATLNAIVSLVTGAFVGNGGGFAIAATALPGVLFLLPIVLAKLGLGESARESSSASSYVRIATTDELPSRVRIADADDISLAEESEQQSKAARALVA